MKLKLKKVIFDVGENIGLYSCYMAKRYPNLKIFAFEPHPKIRNTLKDLISSNNINNISIYENEFFACSS